MSDLRASALIPAAQSREGDDPIFLLNADAARRSAAGESILNATLGALMDEEGRLAVMPSVLDAFAAVDHRRAAAYAPISGLPAFLDAAIDDFAGAAGLSDTAVAASTPGGSGAIHQAVVNFIEPGQRMLVSSYHWGPYRVIAEHAGRGIDTFRMFGDDGRLDLAALQASIDRHLTEQGRLLLVLNFPCHNPTGYSLDATEWEAVAGLVRDAAARAPTAVLLDVAYLRFAPDSAQGWIQALPAMLDGATVLVAWTASKSFAQYGSRVGALIAMHRDPAERKRLAAALGYTCRATWSNCNHRGQLAVAALLTEPEARARADAERAGLTEMLQRRVDAFKATAEGAVAFPRYDGGFFVSVFTPDARRTAEVMREAGVYVVPMPGAVRVALCSTPADAIPRLVGALGEGVKAVQP